MPEGTTPLAGWAQAGYRSMPRLRTTAAAGRVREGTLEDRSSRCAAGAPGRQPGAAGGFARRIVRPVVTEASPRSEYVIQVPRPPAHLGIFYQWFLPLLDGHLAPRSYFEIGTHTGDSLAAFSCDAICVDVDFQLAAKVTGRRARTLLYQMSADAFFASYDLHRDFPAGPDICFLDGLHYSEVLLRDFINAERSCHAGSLILLHDCLPTNVRMAQRERVVDDAEPEATRYYWTGDVWRVIRALRRHRPDLHVRLLNCPPTGSSHAPDSTHDRRCWHGAMR